MSQYREYQNPMVGQASCSYSNLRSTYGPSGSFAEIPSMATYQVPKYCPGGPAPNYPPAYDTLSHGGKGGCGGYFNLKSAFPDANCSSCLGKPFAKYQNNMGYNTASNIPATALGQFVPRACASNVVNACSSGPSVSEGYRRRR